MTKPHQRTLLDASRRFWLNDKMKNPSSHDSKLYEWLQCKVLMLWHWTVSGRAANMAPGQQVVNHGERDIYACDLVAKSGDAKSKPSSRTSTR